MRISLTVVSLALLVVVRTEEFRGLIFFVIVSSPVVLFHRPFAAISSTSESFMGPLGPSTPGSPLRAKAAAWPFEEVERAEGQLAQPIEPQDFLPAFPKPE